jgi:hypothetical protein
MMAKRVKLGMTIQPRKKTTFDKLGGRMVEGAKEQRKLEQAGVEILDRFGGAARRGQRKLPKATPGGRRGGARA